MDVIWFLISISIQKGRLIKAPRFGEDLGDQKSLEVARAILQGYKDLGLPIRSEGIKEAVKGTRPSWIRHYEMPAVELEPLFVTNPDEARWIHNETNLDSMAAMLVKIAETQLPSNATVGLSTVGLSTVGLSNRSFV